MSAGGGAAGAPVFRRIRRSASHGLARPRGHPLETKPDPRFEHSNDVILRVIRAAICGSDLHLYRGLVPDTRVGHTFGHEFTGIVEEIGPGVRHLRAGDRVAVPFNISCGTCYYGQRELFGLCENTNPNSEIAAGPSASSCRSPHG